MSNFTHILKSLDAQSDEMLALLKSWASINSHTFNLDGLKSMSNALAQSFAVFHQPIQMLDLTPLDLINSRGDVEKRPLGQALTLHVRPKAPLQVFLMIHMDTVYPLSDFQQETLICENNILKGPGVADAKGGIVVLLKALETFERCESRENLGWTVLINPDEEVGSPGSRHLLEDYARNNHYGLLFEPSLPNGNLVGARKGSGNFTLVVRGRSAHAGRDINLGRNAIEILSKCILKLRTINGSRPGLTVNVGMVEGGRALNVVPDMAIVRFNVRIEKQEDEAHVWVDMKNIIEEYAELDGISLELHGAFFALPKVLNKETLDVYQNIQKTAQEIDLKLGWEPSGGVCDGNRLAAFGLPNVDTLGVKGGHLHSPDEYMEIDSLTQRAKLTALYLMKLSAGEFN